MNLTTRGTTTVRRILVALTFAAISTQSAEVLLLEHHQDLVVGTTTQDSSRALMSENARHGFRTIAAVLLFCTALSCFTTALIACLACCCYHDRRESRRSASMTTSTSSQINNASSPTEATTTGANISLCSILSPDERRVYVKDLLKIESFETTENNYDDDDASITGGHIMELGGEKAESSPSLSAKCAICLEMYKDGSFVCRSNNAKCLHTFHHSCMSDWLLRHDECPVCRRSYLFESSW